MYVLKTQNRIDSH